MIFFCLYWKIIFPTLTVHVNVNCSTEFRFVDQLSISQKKYTSRFCVLKQEITFCCILLCVRKSQYYIRRELRLKNLITLSIILNYDWSRWVDVSTKLAEFLRFHPILSILFVGFKRKEEVTLHILIFRQRRRKKRQYWTRSFVCCCYCCWCCYYVARFYGIKMKFAHVILNTCGTRKRTNEYKHYGSGNEMERDASSLNISFLISIMKNFILRFYIYKFLGFLVLLFFN